MTQENVNQIVAKELSEAMSKCQQQGVDETSLRTGLLTITIANFVNRAGMKNAIDLFEVLPAQIRTGIFDKFINPEIEAKYGRPTPSAPSSTPDTLPTSIEPKSLHSAFQLSEEVGEPKKASRRKLAT